MGSKYLKMLLPFILFFSLAIMAWGQFKAGIDIDTSFTELEIADRQIENLKQTVEVQKQMIVQLVDSIEYLQKTANVMLWATIAITLVFVVITIFLFIEEFRLWKKV